MKPLEQGDELPLVVRSRITFDTRAPRDLREGELAVLYDVEDGHVFRFMSLDRPRLIAISIRDGRQRRALRKLFDVVA